MCPRQDQDRDNVDRVGPWSHLFAENSEEDVLLRQAVACIAADSRCCATARLTCIPPQSFIVSHGPATAPSSFRFKSKPLLDYFAATSCREDILPLDVRCFSLSFFVTLCELEVFAGGRKEAHKTDAQSER